MEQNRTPLEYPPCSFPCSVPGRRTGGESPTTRAKGSAVATPWGRNGPLRPGAWGESVCRSRLLDATTVCVIAYTGPSPDVPRLSARSPVRLSPVRRTRHMPINLHLRASALSTPDGRPQGGLSTETEAPSHAPAVRGRRSRRQGVAAQVSCWPFSSCHRRRCRV